MEKSSNKMRNLSADEVIAISEGIRDRGRTMHGAAGQFGSARLGKQIDSAQNDMPAILLTVGESLVGHDEEGFNGIKGYEALAVALQSAADFFANLEKMKRPDDLFALPACQSAMPYHLRRIEDGPNTRGRRLSEIAGPLAVALGQALSLHIRLRKADAAYTKLIEETSSHAVN